MSPTRLLAVLLIVAAMGVLGLRSLLSRNVTERNFEVFTEMAYAPAYEAFEPNSRFSDGRTLRVPVAGTIPRGLMPFPYSATEEDAARCGRELQNPYAGSTDPAVLARGKEEFQAICSACHGPGGAGDGPVTRRGVPPPPSLLAENALKLADGEIYHIITLGRGNMAAHGAQVARRDRWKIVRHIRHLQESQQ